TWCACPRPPSPRPSARTTSVPRSAPRCPRWCWRATGPPPTGRPPWRAPSRAPPRRWSCSWRNPPGDEGAGVSGDQGGGRPGDERSGEPARTGARDGEPAAEEQPAKRKRMAAADRRDQLLDVTRDIVVAEGFAAVGIDRVARAAGVARALIYQQFGDLAGLTAVLLERETQVAFRGMQTVDWSGAQAEGADVDQVGRGILAYVHAAPDSWRILLSPPEIGRASCRERIEVG